MPHIWYGKVSHIQSPWTSIRSSLQSQMPTLPGTLNTSCRAMPVSVLKGVGKAVTYIFGMLCQAPQDGPFLSSHLQTHTTPRLDCTSHCLTILLSQFGFSFFLFVFSSGDFSIYLWPSDTLIWMPMTNFSKILVSQDLNRKWYTCNSSKFYHAKYI